MAWHPYGEHAIKIATFAVAELLDAESSAHLRRRRRRQRNRAHRREWVQSYGELPNKHEFRHVVSEAAPNNKNNDNFCRFLRKLVYPPMRQVGETSLSDQLRNERRQLHTWLFEGPRKTAVHNYFARCIYQEHQPANFIVDLFSYN